LRSIQVREEVIGRFVTLGDNTSGGDGLSFLKGGDGFIVELGIRADSKRYLVPDWRVFKEVA
jgi:hypothetical protein